VLLHGLTGCADSRYVLRAAGRLLDAGFPVLRLNLRGAGPCRKICREQYHSGRSQDLEAVLDQLPSSLTGNGLVTVGWSLGANVLLKGLAEFGDAFPIRAAVSVSAPIDLAAAAAQLGSPRNRVYHRRLLARMKQELAQAPDELMPAIRAALAGVRSIIEFDDRFTAPRNGFADAAHYYSQCSAGRFMPAIPVPTLVIHALDDPWIPGAAYREYDWAGNPNLTPLLPRRGGHVGFHAVGGRVWSDDCMVDYLRRLTG
jgi:predicted alpha/beta-fold hydrolase